MDELKILAKIVKKGSMMGKFCEPYLNDSVMAKQYIIEMKQYIHPNSALVKLWGKSLTKQIKNFNQPNNETL